MDKGRGVLCVGLSCVDMMLLNSDRPKTMEAITAFDGTAQVAGGSCSNVSRVLAALKIKTVAVTLIGNDPHGKELERQLEVAGVDVSMIIKDDRVNTSLAVLPVFRSGGRGCFVDLGANLKATPEWLFGGPGLPRLAALKSLGVFHFGYPHLMTNLQGENLARMLLTVRQHSMLVSLDVNGADKKEPGVLSQALPYCCLVHANLEEAAVIVKGKDLSEETATPTEVDELAEFFLNAGVGVITISLGKSGAYLRTNADPDILSRVSNGRVLQPNLRIFHPAYEITGPVNATGAGDAFVAGALAYTSEQDSTQQNIDPEKLLHYALLTASLQVDTQKTIVPFNLLTAPPHTIPSRFIDKL